MSTIKILVTVLLIGGLSTATLTGAFAPATPAAPALAPVIPTAAQLVGTWEVKFSAKSQDLVTGEKFNDRDSDVIGITRVSDTEILIAAPTDGGNQPAHYINGWIILARGDDPALAGSASVMSLKVSGKPGKLKFKGDGLEFNLFDNSIDKIKISGKQVQVP